MGATHLYLAENKKGRDFIVGDIHGCLNELKAMLTHVNFNENDRLISTGDLIDRGPFSYETIDLFRTKSNFYAVKGNHDQILSEYLLGNDSFNLDYQNNCHNWFKSHVDHESMPENITYLKDLPHILTIRDNPNYLAHIVHAGISLPTSIENEISRLDYLSDLELMEQYDLVDNHAVSDLKQKIKSVSLTDEDIVNLNIRDIDNEFNFLWNRNAFKYRILHRQSHALLYTGHNAIQSPIQLGKTIYLDTGIAYAYYSDYQEGKLTMAELHTSRVYQCNMHMEITENFIENYSETKPYLNFSTK